MPLFTLSDRKREGSGFNSHSKKKQQSSVLSSSTQNLGVNWESECLDAKVFLPTLLYARKVFCFYLKNRFIMYPLYNRVESSGRGNLVLKHSIS